ncbi:hypothetical protein AJ78_03766 [Emergomyces pasteurianus Ep9510]|uniref:Uncharacterized protein n=1 Tax=Emergomyces pasteurianus Ep9510 TaxID=1447872 RepID=A0A1J9QLH8_9EURO|nr:hypothetical protein AJ78_03766 [Emergomyces pasteurianus Ep9510]
MWSGIFEVAPSQRNFGATAFQHFLQDVPGYMMTSLKGVKGEDGCLLKGSSRDPDTVKINASRNNYLAALTCPWAFIFISASWAAAHQRSISYYTGATAPIVDTCDRQMKTALSTLRYEAITAPAPASVTEALNFLSHYCATYGLVSKDLRHLFAALALPTHSIFARPAALPTPYHAAQERPITAAGIALVLRNAL